MMASATDPKFAFKYTVVGTDDVKRDTLVEGGVLLVDISHWIKTARSEMCTLRAGSDWEYNLHHMEYMWLDVFDWPDYAMSRGLAWYLRPSKPARFLASAEGLGLLKWTAFESDEAAVQHLLWIKPQLPPSERGFLQTDMHEYPEPAPIISLLDRVRPVMFKDGGGIGMTAAVDYKCILSDAFVKSRRDATDGHHQSMISVLLDAASTNDLASKPLPVQASKVIGFVISTQPPRALRHYLPYEMQEQEVARRALSESGRFIPLLIAAWDDGRHGGYLELKLAVAHACSGALFVEHVKTMAVRAKYTEDITPSICTALCDMLRGDILSQIDTAEWRMSSNADRCCKLGELLAAATSRSPVDATAARASDETAAAKMRASAPFQALSTSLEALVSSAPDYHAVIKLLAPTAVGRKFLNGGPAATPIIAKFTAARIPLQLDGALNKELAVEEDGKPLGKTLALNKLCLKMILGKFAAKQFDPWKELCYIVVAARDGKETADAECQDPVSFWSDYSRLMLTKPIMIPFMAFFGHVGRSTGTYVSYHEGMTQRARKLKALPSTFQKKAGLLKFLARIGDMVMSAAAEADATMMSEPLGIAYIRSPFFPAGSMAYNELALFDADYAEARSKARLHEDYHADEDGDFRPAKMPRGAGDDWRSQYDGQQWYNSSADHWWEDKTKAAGHMLKSHAVYLTKHGLLYGNKYLVVIDGDISTVPHNTCLGALCYYKRPERRFEWCNKGKCTHHNRPNGFTEEQFRVINIYATDLTGADATKAAEVIASEPSWTHWGGSVSKEIMGGKPRSEPANRTKGKGGKGGGGKGGGSGKGGGGKGGKGGKGKGGKGKGGKGKGAMNFGRQR